MDKEKNDNIVKFTKKTFLKIRNDIISAKESIYSISDEEVRINVKEGLELKLAEVIALLIFLDTIAYNPNFINDGFLIDDEIINNYSCAKDGGGFLFSDIIINCKVVQANFDIIISKYYFRYKANIKQLNKALNFANGKIKPLLNISTQEEVVMKKTLR